MKRITISLIALAICMSAYANKFSYSFSKTPVSEALVTLVDNHPDLTLSFIFKELDNYRTSAKIDTDDPYTAIRQIIGLNPISVTEKKGILYIEAMQHGKYIYHGQVIDREDNPVVAATVMLLTPKDSTVLTYGITDNEGRFRIPCDKKSVIAKLTCIGYTPLVRSCDSFNLGTLRMIPQPLQLKGVALEGQMAATYSDKSVYVPTGRQRNASQNAIDLLQKMAIPQVRISLTDNTVTDNAGEPVSVYINYLEASREEMEGLRTADVRRVEYLEFPTDPRFRGAKSVINIIVQEYAYGGYTKTTVNENMLTGLSSRINVFSKFTYKKMTFDLYAGANNRNDHHSGRNTDATYLLKDDEDNEFSLNRKEIVKSSDFKQNQYPVTMRATYATDKTQIRNLVGFSHLGVPLNSYSGQLIFSPSDVVKGYEFERGNPYQSNGIVYSGTYFFSLPKGYSIDFSPSFNYSHSNDRSIYTMSERDEIYRHAKENAYDYRINLFIRKRLGSKHSVMIGAIGGEMINHLDYLGSNGYRDRFNDTYAAGMTGYNFMTQKIAISINGGLLWDNSDINGKKHHDLYPTTNINVRYVLNKKNMVSTYLQYTTFTPEISEKSPDILQENELMYISGNPLLENTRHTSANLTYTWFPSNTLWLNAFGGFYGFYDRLLITYFPYKDGHTLLRTYINNGNYLSSNIGVAVNYKLLNGKLQLSGNIKQSFYKSTGIYNHTCNPLNLSAQIIYYLGKYYFQAEYMSSNKLMLRSSPVISHTPNIHRLTVGWTNSNWNIRIMAANLFNKGWSGDVFITNSPYYLEKKTSISTTYHPRINLTATYSFGYGKKVQRRNEIGEQEGAASAILK